MRPLTLKISAFSSYSGTTVLDMDRLGKSGLYLITGETGAGKTTIFDAITFALYGKPSGSGRKAEMLRSKYADPAVPTEVELTFEYKNKIYTIKRNPEYERPAKRGDKLTKQEAGAELTLPDGRVVSKIKDVDSAVREIIGIDREQFSQIAMIAQGDFLKLLNATTETRQEIFRKIFSTDFYRNIQEKLKAEHSEIKRAYETAEQSIKEYIRGAVCPKDNPLYDELEKAAEGALPPEKAIGIIDEIIVEDEAAEKDLEAAINDADKQLEAVTERIARAEEYEKSAAELIKAEEEMEENRLRHKSVSENAALCRSRESEAQRLKQSAAVIEAELAEYDELEHAKNNLSLYEKNISDSRKKLEAVSDEHKELSDSCGELENELKVLENAGENREKLSLEKEQAEHKREKLKRLKSCADEYERLKKSLEIKQSFYIEALKSAEQKQELYNVQYRAFLNEQAGILAADLQENVPCPVCGSPVHPAPAEKSSAAPAKEQLEMLKEAAAEARDAANAASAAAGTEKGRLSSAEKALEALVSELSENGGINSASDIFIKLNDENDACIKRLENEISAENKRIERKKEIAEKLPDLREKIKSSEKEISDLKEAVTADNAFKTEAEKRISALSSKLKFGGRREAKYEIKRLSKSAEEIISAIADSDKKLAECERLIASVGGKISQLKAQLADRPETDLPEEKEKKLTLSGKRGELIEAQKNIHSRNTANKNALRNITEKTEKSAELLKKYTAVKALCDTAGGNITGREKIMLETYVQAVYFDRIISRANTRLKIMSGGQYELRRKDKAENNRSQSGLELKIIDYYNKTERDVGSLSGGESFKASLALALGLSDEIQSHSGGIKLDAMFIDEGFGSLDENSLSQAINALAQLTAENRIVGIISHVTELKRRIDKQIVVTKVKKDGQIGTKAEIIC